MLYDFETLKTEELYTTLLTCNLVFCEMYKSNALTYNKLFKNIRSFQYTVRR